MKQRNGGVPYLAIAGAPRHLQLGFDQPSLFEIMLKIQILSGNKVSQKLPMATPMATPCKFRQVSAGGKQSDHTIRPVAATRRRIVAARLSRNAVYGSARMPRSIIASLYALYFALAAFRSPVRRLASI